MPDSPADGLSAKLCEHIAAARFEALPKSTVEATKRALLDGIGVMLAASGTSEEIRPFVDLARRTPGGAAILGTGLQASAEAAAFANGAMAHALDFEDAFDLAPVHPNASLIPAALALAQVHGAISGKDFITAVAVGCDLACRMGLSLRQPMEDGGWYPPPILASFGAVAGAALCRRLSPRQIADAFSLLMCQVSCPGEIKYSADTVIRAVREAFPARAAVTSVELAAGGVRGFDAPLEGKASFFRLYADGKYEASDLLRDLGQSFWIDRLTFKAWPSCRGTHAYIEAALSLRQRHEFDWREIEGIALDIGEIQQMLAYPDDRKKRPATAIDAKFSLPFTVAAALVRGEVTLDEFTPGALAADDILSVAGKVTCSRRPEWDRRFATAGALHIILRDGRRFAAEVLDPLGSPDRPLSEDQSRAKFVDCATRAARPLLATDIARTADRILALEHEDDVGLVFAGL